MRDWFKSLFIWCQWANTKGGGWVLFICAFADASFLPLSTAVLFLALTSLNITNAYKYALYGTLGTLFGALAGYAIGHFAWLTADGAFTGLAQFLFHHLPGFSEAIFNEINVQFVKWDFWILFVAVFIPIPYKLFSISSGAFDMNIFMFCAAALISQAIKFHLLALLIIHIGPEVKKLPALKFKHIAIIATVVITAVMVTINGF